jgi:hypothetical protein
VEPGKTSITLTGTLAIPANVTNVTIEGNGVILKKGWDDGSQPLLNITNADAEVTIRGVQFTGGGYVGRAVKNAGKLTLESCIFSGNDATGEITGSAVWSNNDLTIRGCTFYQNTGADGGRVVHFDAPGKTLTLTGNLFYDNSAPLVTASGTITASYNVANVDFGSGNGKTGWEKGTTDKTLTELLGNNNKPFDTNFKPVAGLNNVISTKPADFPATDFYGEVRTFPGAPGAVK